VKSFGEETVNMLPLITSLALGASFAVRRALEDGDASDQPGGSATVEVEKTEGVQIFGVLHPVLVFVVALASVAVVATVSVLLYLFLRNRGLQKNQPYKQGVKVSGNCQQSVRACVVCPFAGETVREPWASTTHEGGRLCRCRPLVAFSPFFSPQVLDVRSVAPRRPFKVRKVARH
jgi:hypothetical protein